MDTDGIERHIIYMHIEALNDVPEELEGKMDGLLNVINRYVQPILLIYAIIQNPFNISLF